MQPEGLKETCPISFYVSSSMLQFIATRWVNFQTSMDFNNDLIMQQILQRGEMLTKK